MEILRTVLALALLGGCGDDGPSFAFETTPQGYQATFVEKDPFGPGSTFENGVLTLDAIYQAHADAVDRAIADNGSRYGWTAEAQYAVAHRYRWVLVDNSTFYGYWVNSWATGEWNGHDGIIAVALYRRVQGPCSESDETYPWTHRHNPADPEECRWGVLDVLFAALRHEMCHAVTNNPCFEHPCGSGKHSQHFGTACRINL